MSEKHALLGAGIILIFFGVLGGLGILGPTATDSFLGSWFWFDVIEIRAWLAAGIICLLAALIIAPRIQRRFLLTLGTTGVLISLYSFFNPILFSLNLEKPADTILYLIVGLWALKAPAKL